MYCFYRIESTTDACLSNPPGWKLWVHPQGWVYFSCPEQKVVTDQDVRTHETYDQILEASQLYPISDLEEGMEVHLQVGPPGTAAFNLVINHNHCLASYELGEVKDNAVSSMDMKTCEKDYFHNYLGFTS